MKIVIELKQESTNENVDAYAVNTEGGVVISLKIEEMTEVKFELTKDNIEDLFHLAKR
ncbi:hypothetical protein [Psychromonas ossibalaenae]|uniref:hypothetical protein n=1 Tax=Psychromonas ossibalaenae TaxID=444922 RepID=UPI00035C415C|nr:hypothetical protein [Psychromonas ossibalaenae]